MDRDRTERRCLYGGDSVAERNMNLHLIMPINTTVNPTIIICLPFKDHHTSRHQQHSYSQ
jgi:hypothetical protein